MNNLYDYLVILGAVAALFVGGILVSSKNLDKLERFVSPDKNKAKSH
jgi:hypothetical protein